MPNIEIEFEMYTNTIIFWIVQVIAITNVMSQIYYRDKFLESHRVSRLSFQEKCSCKQGSKSSRCTSRCNISLTTLSLNVIIISWLSWRIDFHERRFNQFGTERPSFGEDKQIPAMKRVRETLTKSTARYYPIIVVSVVCLRRHRSRLCRLHLIHGSS